MSKHRSAITDLFVQRPILAVVVTLIIVIAGIQAIVGAVRGSGDFTVRQYPRTENASVKVTTVYVGASSELVKGFVTSPLERAIAEADGIEYLESSSKQGLSTITARLRLNYDASKALSEISSKVDQVRADLPPEAEVPIINIETADSQIASVYLSFRSDRMQANEVTDYLVRVVQPALSALPGVQKAEILGGRHFAMRLWLEGERMAAYGVSATEVRKALLANNVLASIGSTQGRYVQLNLTANTDLSTEQEFRELVVAERGGRLVRLGDVAEVELGAEDYNVDVRFSGEQAVFMGVWVLPTANSLEVIKRVRTQMGLLEQRYPAGFAGDIAYDATEYIELSIHEVVKTLLETLLIVVAVIFLFLGSVRSALIPVVVIPITLIGSVFLMQAFGFSINLLTLLAIVLSVGLVVDDAIVVVENVERHLREGQSPFDAALYGARELIGPIIATMLTLIAVYAPIAFQGGLTGALFREFAVTLAGAVFISGIVALTLSPMMASQFLREGQSERGFARRVNQFFDRLAEAYSRAVAATLRARAWVYGFWAVITLSVLPLFFFASMTTELAPTEDQGVVFGALITPSNSTVEQISHFGGRRVQEAFQSVPEYHYSFQLILPTEGFGGVLMKPWGERTRTIFEIRGELMMRLMMNPGVQFFPFLPASLPGGENFPVQLVVASTADIREVYAVAEKIAAAAAQSGKFAFPPQMDMQFDEPQARVIVDRERVADLGLSLADVVADIGLATGGNYVNRFAVQGRSYKVIPQLRREERLNPEQLEQLYIRGGDGTLIPLSSVAHIESGTEPRSLNRFNQLNAVKISGVPAGPLDAVLRSLEEEAARVMPAGYVLDYAGESRQLRMEGGRFLPALGLALVLIFLVLAAQFNSFRDPLIILLGSVPLAMFGALIFVAMRAPGDPWTPHWTWGWTTSWNIYSQVGLITLIGLVSKNSILIVQFANVLQREGRTKLEAVREAAVTRLRPILMTTCATVFGHMMLVFVSGPGAAARNSIGLVLVCGMAIGSLMTLYVVPALYVLIAREHHEKPLDDE